MIVLNRLNGQPFALNPDLLERAEATPDTVITLLTGAKYVVAQSLVELAALVRDYRAQIVARAQEAYDEEPADTAPAAHPVQVHQATVLRLPEREH